MILNTTKVSALLGSMNTHPFKKPCQTKAAVEMLQLCQPNPDDYFSRLITMDECWVYHYDPETKEQSRQWKHVDSPSSKKVKTQPQHKNIQ